jgi:hypothetical protein
LGDFSDGFQIAGELHDLAARLDAHLQTHVAHETDEGAHAAAFEAHDQSPGVVEDAEELAAAIIETATETADDAIEAVQDAGTETLAVIADASEEAVEVPSEVVGTSEPEPEPEAPEEPHSSDTKPPSRGHILHRKVIG